MFKALPFIYLTFIFYFPLHASFSIQDKELYTSDVASLVYVYRQQLDEFKNDEDQIQFTQEEIASLWDRTAHYLYHAPLSNQRTQNELIFEKAYKNYSEGINSSQKIQETYSHLEELWSDAIENEVEVDEYELHMPLRMKSYANKNFENNKLIPERIKDYMRPYVLPDTHPMKAVMDSIFKDRVTYNEKIFIAAGFKIISKRPRSYVYVAKHPKLSGYLVKAYMDTEKRLKRYIDSWNWLVKRCQGAAKIRAIIKKYHFKYFRVADKWLYALPDKRLPPKDDKHKFHYAVLLAQDMNLIDYDENVKKWKTEVTKEILKELYYIITYAKGSSYRPDNICFTKEGDLAFIDTEYPSQGPDYYSIRHYLSANMRKYWDGLVKNGLR